MSEKDTAFSEETEKAYKSETESAIKVPDGFKNAVINKVKVEKMKNRKKTIIAISSVAAALVVAVGAIYAVSTMKGAENTRSADEFVAETAADAGKKDEFVPFEGLEGFGKVDDNVDNEERMNTLNEEMRQYLKSSTYSETPEATDGTETGTSTENYNWYQFYNAVVEGKIDPRTEEAKKYIEEKMNYFDAKDMEEEKKEAEAIIDAVEPFEGLPDEEEISEDFEEYPEYTISVELFLKMNNVKGPGDRYYNWFEFYNACVRAEIDPRFGDASIFLDDCYECFTAHKYETGIAQCELIYAACGITPEQ